MIQRRVFGDVPATACDTCAYGKAGAAEEPVNAMTALLCAAGAIPFFCHHGKDGQEYDWQTDPLGPLRLHPANRKVCAGWRGQVQKLKQAGYFRSSAVIAIRRYVARRGLEWFNRCCIPDIGRVKSKQAEKELRRCVKFVATKDISTLSIP